MSKIILDAVETQLFQNDQTWVVSVITVLAFVIITSFVASRYIKKIKRSQVRTGSLKYIILDVSLGPARLFIWAIGLGLIADIIYGSSKLQIFSLASEAFDILAVVSLAWLMLRASAKARSHSLKRIGDGETQKLDYSNIEAAFKLLNFSIFVFTGLLILQHLGFSISGVLAFGGAGGLVVGLAAKDYFNNFFGAITVLMDKPFVVGDYISSPDKQIEGVVEHVGWRITRIRNLDRVPLYVPNAVFTNIIVQNFTRMSHRRFKEWIGIRYDDLPKAEAIVKSIEDYIKTNQDIDQAETILVKLNRYSASSVDILVSCFTRHKVWTEFQAIRQRILLKIGEIIAKHGAEIAYPTSVMHIPKRKLDEIIEETEEEDSGVGDFDKNDSQKG